jgi:hypothetical protein
VERQVTVFKAGYEEPFPGRSDDKLMRKYQGSGEMRLDGFRYVWFLRTCGWDKPAAYRQILPLARAMEEEIRTLTVSPANQGKLEEAMRLPEALERELNWIESGVWK